MMKRTAACLAMLMVLGAATPAHAAIKIKKIAFDPAGTDSGTNAHLNKEWIKIKNTGTKARSLKGWKLHDRGRDYTYRFGELSLGPGEYVRVHTGRGQNSGVTGCNGHCFTYYDSYWGLENYVWNNDGDRATLKKPNGNVVDRCTYTASADSPQTC
jgi:hypothetical protein